MLPFRVVATHQSRSSQPALIFFPPCSHASLFFTEDYVPSSATGAPQPFVYQSLPHSFHRDGVCTPPSCLRRSEVQTCGRFNVLPSYPLCFQILAHSFAHRKKLSHLFSWDSALFAQNTRGGGRM